MATAIDVGDIRCILLRQIGEQLLAAIHSTEQRQTVRPIRARTDRGAVVLLDSRVVRKPYGRVFLDSLPPAHRHIADRRAVYAALRQLFSQSPHRQPQEV